jgi:hypothetical protein
MALSSLATNSLTQKSGLKRGILKFSHGNKGDCGQTRAAEAKMHLLNLSEILTYRMVMSSADRSFKMIALLMIG